MSSHCSILGTRKVPRGMVGWIDRLLDNKSDLVCTEEKTKAQGGTHTEGWAQDEKQ